MERYLFNYELDGQNYVQDEVGYINKFFSFLNNIDHI